MEGSWVSEKLDETEPSFHLCLSLKCDTCEMEADVVLNLGILEVIYYTEGQEFFGEC